VQDASKNTSNNSFSRAAHVTTPRRTTRRAAVAATLLALAAGPLQALAQGMTVYNNSCSTNGTGCHAFPPEGARLNAAGAPAVITQANTTHGMGFSAGFMTANAGNIATYIGTLISGSQTVNVNYNATVGFTVNDIVLNNAGGGIVTTINQVSAPGRGNLLGSGTASVSYQHTATNCTSDSFQVRGQGLQNTSNRTINITVNAPSAPVAANTSTTIGYNTSAQTINLSALGALSGTAPAVGTTPGLGTPSPNVGTVAGTAPTSLTYAANATTYAPTVTVVYNVTGPCGTTSATRTLTINVNAPPAPVAADAGPIAVSGTVATPINLAAFISGAVASNPAATYNLVASQPTVASSGSTSVAGDVVTYTPNGVFSGMTTFTYTKAGPGGVSNTATVTLNVAQPPPIAGPLAVSVGYGVPTPIDLAAAITGTATSVTPSGALNGSAIASGPTTVTFTPTAGYSGPASFSYTATNAAGTSAPALVSINVAPLSAFSGPSATGTGVVTASFVGGGPACVFAAPQFIAPPPGAPPIPPTVPIGNVVFPHGLFDFSASGCVAGGTLAFTIVYPQPLRAGTKYWKYGPTAADPAPHWYLLPATIAGNTATFVITDGGLGDDDLVANGTIVDQGGPGAGLGSSIPTLGVWGMLLLVLLMLSSHAHMDRRRRQ
jgi:hypothetical protein